MLTKKATPTQSLSPSTIAAPMTRRAPNAPASAQTSAQARGPMTQHATGRPTAPDSAFATASNKTLPGVDPSWGPSATPAQQARNIENTKKAAEQRQQEAVKTQQTAARTPSNTQNKGALQSALERFNLSPAASTTPAAPTARVPGSDLRERVLAARANAAPATPQRTPPRTPDQMAADVGEQPMTGSVGPHGKNIPADVARVQRALVQNGTMHPATATGYIGTATLDAIRAYQKKHGLKIDGLITPGGPTEAALMDGSIDQWRAEQKQKAFGKPIAVSEFKDFRDEFDQRLNNPKYNTMTPGEALGPVAKYGALRLMEQGAPIASHSIKNEAVGDAIDLLGGLSGWKAEQVKRDYLENPQAKTKAKTLEAKTEQQSKQAKQPAMRPRTPQPPVEISPAYKKTIADLLSDERPSTSEWLRNFYQDEQRRQ